MTAPSILRGGFTVGELNVSSTIEDDTVANPGKLTVDDGITGFLLPSSEVIEISDDFAISSGVLVQTIIVNAAAEITFPPLGGTTNTYLFIKIIAGEDVVVTLTPQSTDAIGFALAVDDTSISNVGSANKGDFVTFAHHNETDVWQITDIGGTWAIVV